MLKLQTLTVFNLRQIRNGEQKGYLLKNKELTGPTKGAIYLEIDVIYNTVSVVCVCGSAVWSDLGHTTCSALRVLLFRSKLL